QRASFNGSEWGERHGRWAGLTTGAECLAGERCGSSRDTIRDLPSSPPRRISCTSRSQYSRAMPDYRFTRYFEQQVMRKRPYVSKEMCIRVVRSPIRAELQENDRYRLGAERTSLADDSCESSRFPIN